MKRSFHLCLSAHNEVMFRDQEDYDRESREIDLKI